MIKIRYPASSCLLIFGMIVCMISSLIGLELYDNYSNQKEEASGYSYACQIDLQFEESVSYEDIVEYLSGIDSLNARLENTGVYVDGLNEVRQCFVVIKEDLKQKFPLIEGDMPNAAGENQVAIGRELLNCSFTENSGTYIKLAGEKYLVTGIIGAKTSDGLDNIILMNMNSISDKLQKKYKGESLYFLDVYIQSDRTTLADSVNELINQGMKAQIIDETRQSSELLVSEKNSSVTVWAIYGFAIIVVIVVMMYYVEQRKREIALKKTFGYSSAKILKEFVLKTLCHFVISMVISAILFVIFNVAMFNNPYDRMTAMYDVAFDIVVINIITIILVMIKPFIFVMSCPPSSGVKFESGV